jgi:hypothetical protein
MNRIYRRKTEGCNDDERLVPSILSILFILSKEDFPPAD